MAEEWGPWVEHDGKGRPVSEGTVVEGVEADGSRWIGVITGPFDNLGEADVNVWDWECCDRNYCWNWRLIRYRIRKPRGLAILEDLIADLPVPVGPMVDA